MTHSTLHVTEEFLEKRPPPQSSPRPILGLRSDLNDKLRFEMLMAELSTRFAGLTSDSIDEEIVDA
jgi:hypothetical protein